MVLAAIMRLKIMQQRLLSATDGGVAKRNISAMLMSPIQLGHPMEQLNIFHAADGAIASNSAANLAADKVLT